MQISYPILKNAAQMSIPKRECNAEQEGGHRPGTTGVRAASAPCGFGRMQGAALILQGAAADVQDEVNCLVTRRLIQLCVFAAVVFLLSGTVHAAPPDFSGEWKFNAAKSNFGSFPSPQSITRKITQRGARLSVTNLQKGAQGEVTSEFVYTIDGKRVTNRSKGGESAGSAQWIGDKLMIESSREVQGATLTQKDIWTLSPDGKTLTVDSHVALPNGEFDIKQVFEKQ